MKKGFFYDEGKKEKKTQAEPRARRRRSQTKKQRGCEDCGLYKGCQSPRMEVGGKGKKNILIIAEGPGRTEDERGTQLIGKVGRYLEKRMDRFDISLHDDCHKENAIKCRPPKNRDPLPLEIECCRPRTWATIQEKNPRFVLLFGQAAVDSICSHRHNFGKTKIGLWRGFIIPDQEVGAWVFPMYHPSYAARNIGRVEEKVFLSDLELVLRFINSDPGPPPKPRMRVEVVMEEEVILDKLDYVYGEMKRISLDYETTGLKPYKKGHRIVCASIGISNKEAIAFPMESKEVQKAMTRILRNRRIKKIFQNSKFESIWSKEILGTWIQGIEWDTMLVSHLLDNRRGITGLKFQSYVNFGVLGYNLEIEPYLEGVGKDANSFNRIDEFPLDKTLQYCGEDAILTYALKEKQEWEFSRWLKESGEDL